MQKCRRCNAVLLQDVLEEVGVPLQALHCIVCGDCVNPLIFYHRKLAVLPEPSRARTTIFDASATGRVLDGPPFISSLSVSTSRSLSRPFRKESDEFGTFLWRMWKAAWQRSVVLPKHSGVYRSRVVMQYSISSPSTTNHVFMAYILVSESVK